MKLVGRAIVAMMGVGLAALLTPQVQAQAAQAATRADPAVERLGACIATQHEADLLLLIDTSGSLGHAIGGQPPTDPSAFRVTAAKYLLRQLAQSERNARFDVAIAGFDVTYHPSGGWQRLSTASLSVLDRNLDSFASRDNGIDTDYTNAFTGARDALRAHNIGGQRCQAILWFTDGQFSIQQRETSYQLQFGTTKPYAPGVNITTAQGVARATTLGELALCRPGGIMDQIRAGNIETFAVGLGVANHNFSLMQSMATGRGSIGSTCGTISPGVAVGSFTLAQDVDDILFAFDMLSDPSNLPVQQEQRICQFHPCSASRDFVLDSSIQAVHVLADTGRPGIEMFLTPPGAKVAALLQYTSGKVSDPQVTGLSGTWITNQILDITLSEATSPSWHGEWSVVFVDPKGTSSGSLAKTSIRITGDLVPRLLDVSSLQLRSNAIPTAHFGVVNSTTQEPVTSILGTASLSAELDTPSGATLPLASDLPLSQLSAGVPVNLSGISPGAATIVLTLNVTTKSPGHGVPGTALSPQVVQVPVSVLPPLDFPTVTTSRVDFGHATGTAPMHALLRVNGPGCVWVGEAAVTASPTNPNDVLFATAKASRPTACDELSEGASVAIPLTLSVSKPGTGIIAGTFIVHLAPTGAPANAVTQSVAFIADVEKPANQAIFWSSFLLALLLGLALPIGFLYLARWRAARIPAGSLLVGQLPIEISETGVRRDGMPLAISDRDCSFFPVPRATRRLTPLPGLVLRSCTPLNPLSAGHTRVDAASSAVVTADGSGRLPIAVHGSWVVLLAEPGRHEARLVLLLAASSANAVFTQVADQVVRLVPAQVTRLRAEVKSTGLAPDGGSAGAQGFDFTPGQSSSGFGYGSSSPTSQTGGSGFGPVPSGPTSPRTPAATPPPDGGEANSPSSGSDSWW